MTWTQPNRPVTRFVRVAAWIAAGVLGAIGLTAGPAVILPLALFAVMFGAMGGYAFASRAGGAPDGSGGRPPRPFASVVRFAVGGIGFVVVVTGAVLVLGAAVVPVAVLGLGVVGWSLWSRRRPEGSGPDDATSGGMTFDLGQLSDAELGRAWSRSHTRLVRARDGAELRRITELRRRQLDEMERRNPAGFRRWIGSGGWVLGDRAPFLGG